MLNRRCLLKVVSGVSAGLAGISLLPKVGAAQENGPGSIRWTFSVDESGLGALLHKDDSLYAMSSTSVYALDAGSGAERWRFATEGIVPVISSLGESAVYARNGGKFSVTIYAIDASTGTERWNLELDGEGFFPQSKSTGRSMLATTVLRFAHWIRLPARSAGASQLGTP